MSVAKLEANRDEAREAAASHPKQARLEELRARAVALANLLKAGDKTPAQKTAAQAELDEITQERASLQLELRAPVSEAQAALSSARRAARADRDRETVAKLRELPSEELEALRSDLTAKRRALKAEQRAVVVVLGERAAERRTAELVATMSDAEKRALFQQLRVAGLDSAEAVGVPGAST